MDTDHPGDGFMLGADQQRATMSRRTPPPPRATDLMRAARGR